MSNRRSPVLQGVRREVGKHAKSINMTLSKTRFHCNDDEDKSTNQPGKPSANIDFSCTQPNKCHCASYISQKGETNQFNADVICPRC